jgi:hypothetical protein
MKSIVIRVVAALCIAALPAVATVAAADAVPRAAAVCPSLKSAGVTLNWSVVGSGFTCGSAKKWVVKLTSEHFSDVGKPVTLTNGPKGYHCKGTTNDSGRATIGSCYLGTVQHPKSGFQWFG